jgi:hypothetical protein
VFLIPRSIALLVVGAALSLSLASCGGENKATQCNKLTAAADKSVSINKKYEEQLQKLQQGSSPKNFNEAKALFGKLAGIFTSFSGELKASNQEAAKLSFSDDKLKGFHTRYVKIAGEQEKLAVDGNKLFQKASKLQKQEDFQKLGPEFISVSQRSITNTQEGKKLVDELKAYCADSK